MVERPRLTTARQTADFDSESRCSRDCSRCEGAIEIRVRSRAARPCALSARHQVSPLPRTSATAALHGSSKGQHLPGLSPSRPGMRSVERYGTGECALLCTIPRADRQLGGDTYRSLSDGRRVTDPGPKRWLRIDAGWESCACVSSAPNAHWRVTVRERP